MEKWPKIISQIDNKGCNKDELSFIQCVHKGSPCLQWLVIYAGDKLSGFYFCMFPLQPV